MIRTVKGKSVSVFVISARRPFAVEPMTKMVGPATWMVAEGERAAYTRAGAAEVVEAGALCRARNMALDLAGTAHCVQLSDDLKRIDEPVFDKAKDKYVGQPISFDLALERMLEGLISTSAYLAGVAPTSNPFFYNGKPIRIRGFIVGDMIMVKPTPLRFDETLRLKEDYDYTLQHINQYQIVARRDDVLAVFAHRSNAGGAVAYRTASLEQETITKLKDKWGSIIKDNPKRPNEILLKL